MVCVAGLLASVVFAGAAETNQLTAAEKAEGWRLLFDGKTTQGWRSFKKPEFPAKGWEVTNGWLHCLGQKGGDIISKDEFAEFDLEWEWKLAPGGNSGVKYFVLESRKGPIAHEYQMLDDEVHPDGKLAEGKRLTATFYDVLKTTVKTPVRPMGEINQSRVRVKGNHVEHWLNGVKVLEYDCGSPELKAAVAKSKFKDEAGFGNQVTGHILLQDHDFNVWFRNVKVKDLAGK